MIFGSGCMWLASTISVADLVVDATALCFILEVDDLLFDVLISEKFKRQKL